MIKTIDDQGSAMLLRVAMLPSLSMVETSTVVAPLSRVRKVANGTVTLAGASARNSSCAAPSPAAAGVGQAQTMSHLVRHRADAGGVVGPEGTPAALSSGSTARSTTRASAKPLPMSSNVGVKARLLPSRHGGAELTRLPARGAPRSPDWLAPRLAGSVVRTHVGRHVRRKTVSLSRLVVPGVVMALVALDGGPAFPAPTAPAPAVPDAASAESRPPEPPPPPSLPPPGEPGLPSAAQARDSIYQLRPFIDIPVILVGVAGTALPYAFSGSIIDPSCPCDRSQVNGFDRGAIGNDSALAGALTDIGAGLAVAAPVVYELLTVHSYPTVLEDLTVYAQVLAVNGAVVTLVKHLVQRPLPRTYAGDPHLVDNARGYRAFYSGHTSLTFAALSAGSMTIGLRHHKYLVPWLTTLAVGSLVGVGRVYGGYHFPSDVLVGAAAGTAIGVVIPLLHARRFWLTVAPALTGTPDTTGLSLAGRF